MITPLVKDKLICKVDDFGCFTIKACLNHLEGVSPLFNLYVPSKNGFFLLGRLWGKVLTSSQLKKRDFHLASKYPFCVRKEEELEHILIHCPSIWRQWTALLSIFGAY